ncbi:unnamed protein product [Cladocopium goreaui]|uniref:Phosphopantothenoylcysteine decarboxylase n=1 Tax=Cladocopium goreaui TaxID=2562237 RepID=A0A9P1M4R1_9DINO|nr:unnamed protein product [Cladocopium goreaui]
MGSNGSVPRSHLWIVAGHLAGLGLYFLSTKNRRLGRATPTCREKWLTEVPEADSPPRIVLVATGSVAAVKVPELARKLADFAEVAVILTAAAEVMTSAKIAGRYAPENFRAWERMDRLHVLRDFDEWDRYEDVSSDLVVHVELRKWADVALVAPCSANTLGKMALGLCDNLAACFLRAWDPDKPLLVAPAMNTVMWEHPSTAQHLSTLESYGCRVVPPSCKRLACGDVGRGALAPVGDVVEAVKEACGGHWGGVAERRSCASAVGSWQRHGFQEWQPATTDDL